MYLVDILVRYRAVPGSSPASFHCVQNYLCWKLEKDMKRLGDKWRILYVLVAMQGAFHPDVVLSVFDKLKLETLEQLESWIDGVNKADAMGLCEMIYPTIEMPENTITATKTDILNLINAASVTDKLDVFFTDKDFQATTFRYMKDLIPHSPSIGYRYIKNRRDCEQFTYILLGFMAKLGLGNIPIGWTVIYTYQQGKYNDTHFFNIGVVTVDGELALCFMEPQNNKIWLEKDLRDGLKIDDYKIARVVI